MAFQFTNEVIGLILAIIVPFGVAMFWLVVVHHRLNTLEKDVRELRNIVTNLSIRIESHILSVDAWKESEASKK